MVYNDNRVVMSIITALIGFSIIIFAVIVTVIIIMLGNKSKRKTLKSNPNMLLEFLQDIETKYPRLILLINSNKPVEAYSLGLLKTMLIYLRYRGLLILQGNNILINKYFRNILSSIEVGLIDKVLSETQYEENYTHYIINSTALLNLVHNPKLNEILIPYNEGYLISSVIAQDTEKKEFYRKLKLLKWAIRKRENIFSQYNEITLATALRKELSTYECCIQAMHTDSHGGVVDSIPEFRQKLKRLTDNAITIQGYTPINLDNLLNNIISTEWFIDTSE